MDTDKKIAAFSKLGNALARLGATREFKEISRAGGDGRAFEKAFNQAVSANAWFTPEDIFKSLYILGVSIDRPDLEQWLSGYGTSAVSAGKSVAVIMAGNIPAVGFHDFLSVLMAGHRLVAKLSSDDRFLIPAIADVLCGIEPGFKEQISFTEGTISGFDAVIATGSNNTSRYFDYYFGKYPHIIRRNRNALGIITGMETREELEGLGEDIFTYYGLGCRNISRLYVPEGYDFNEFFEAMEKFSHVGDHNKYRNNYDYNKSIFLVNGEKHLDNGFMLLRKGRGMPTPVSVLHYEHYTSLDEVDSYIVEERENIQCVVSLFDTFHDSVTPGTAQYPKLWDYADGVDTMAFLLGL